MNNTPTFHARLAVLEREIRAVHRMLGDIEKRMRKQEAWRSYILGAIALGSVLLNLLRGCA